MHGGTLSPLLVLLDDGVDQLGVSEPSFQALSDDVGVVTLFNPKPVYVQSTHVLNIQEIY